MQFRESQAIYLQIAEFVCEKIVLKDWKPQERIPSVREMAVQLEVNPNTVMRTYEFLQQKEIIYNQRGIGFFVIADAHKKAIDHLRNEFLQKDIPSLFRNLYLLNMAPTELEPLFTEYKNQTYGNETKK